jgi:hypothetical protein
LTGAETIVDGCTKCTFFYTSNGGAATECSLDTTLITIVACAALVVVVSLIILTVYLCLQPSRQDKYLDDGSGTNRIYQGQGSAMTNRSFIRPEQSHRKNSNMNNSFRQDTNNNYRQDIGSDYRQ